MDLPTEIYMLPRQNFPNFDRFGGILKNPPPYFACHHLGISANHPNYWLATSGIFWYCTWAERGCEIAKFWTTFYELGKILVRCLLNRWFPINFRSQNLIQKTWVIRICDLLGASSVGRSTVSVVTRLWGSICPHNVNVMFGTICGATKTSTIPRSNENWWGGW